jgi:hypothetical protein
MGILKNKLPGEPAVCDQAEKPLDTLDIKRLSDLGQALLR